MTDLFTTPCCACDGDAMIGYRCDKCDRPVCVDCVCSDVERNPGFLCPSCPGAFIHYMPTDRNNLEFYVSEILAWTVLAGLIGGM